MCTGRMYFKSRLHRGRSFVHFLCSSPCGPLSASQALPAVSKREALFDLEWSPLPLCSSNETRKFIVLPKHKLQGFTHDRGFRGINELGVLGELRLDLLLNP
jgi:hypothetical protein